MPRRGENIYKRKDGRWEGRYIKSHNDLKALYGYVYGKTYKEVKEKLSKAKEKSIGKKTESTGLPFSSYAELWLSEKKPLVKHSTFMKYHNMLERYISPLIGSSLIEELGYDKISDFCTKLLQNGGKKKTGLSPKLVSDCLIVVKSIIRYVARRKYTIDASTLEVSVKLKNKPLRVLSVPEQETVLNHVRSMQTPINTGIVISLFTGMRIGELCALKWEDVSIENMTITINKTLQRVQTPNGPTKTAITITKPKSDCSIRKIPIPAVLIDYLTPSANGSLYVLSNSTKYVEPRTLQNHFKSIISKCQIEDANFHALRHTFVTRCFEINS